MHVCIHNTDQSENNEKDIMNQLTCVGGATFGHRPKARAQFECNDKVSSWLGKPSSQRASSFRAKTGSPQAKTKRSEE